MQHDELLEAYRVYQFHWVVNGSTTITLGPGDGGCVCCLKEGGKAGNVRGVFVTIWKALEMCISTLVGKLCPAGHVYVIHGFTL